MYQHLVVEVGLAKENEDSVHLCDYPKEDFDKIWLQHSVINADWEGPDGTPDEAKREFIPPVAQISGLLPREVLE